MEHEEFTDRMVELLYGELDEEDEAAMRAHLESSSAAREAYARLERGRELAEGLVLETPAPSLLDGVLAAARDEAKKRAPAAALEPEVAAARASSVPREAEPDEVGPWGAFLQWIGSFATRPQFAMAMMLFLMIGIGIFYLPDFRSSDPSDGHAIIDPAPGDEVGPSASLIPDETSPPTAAAADQQPRVHPHAPNRPEPTDPDEVDDAPSPEEQTVLAEAERQEQRLRPSVHPSATDETSAGGVVADPVVDMETVERTGAAAPPVAALDDSVAQSVGGRVEEESMPAVAPSPPPQPAVAPNQPASTRYAQGMQHYSQGEYRQAAEDFAAVIDRPDTDARRLLPSALHHQARSERATGNCGSAVRAYETLLARYRAYSGAPEAMVEAADCYTRLGQLTSARRWLERATQQPSVASRAQRELVVLAARERAAARPNESASSAASATEHAPSSTDQ